MFDIAFLSETWHYEASVHMFQHPPEYLYTLFLEKSLLAVNYFR